MISGLCEKLVRYGSNTVPSPSYNDCYIGVLGTSLTIEVSQKVRVGNNMYIQILYGSRMTAERNKGGVRGKGRQRVRAYGSTTLR